MNRLQYETSPYLIQHASNPVDWYPWGDEAFEKAKAEDKPILLSIGYSACHWCHVMEHESFANPETAALMNEHFVSIKVDREERPDVDDIYMQATLIFTGGHGGWPMTVFLTPEGRPYHAGTYFPPVPRHGMPSFPQVLMAAMDAYQNRRDQLEQLAQQVTESLQNTGNVDGQGNLDALNSELVGDAARKLTARPDRIYGGLHTGQPKFPSPMNLEFLLRYIATSDDQEMLDIVTFTLKKMAQGGIYDQIGGGFHRYSVDNRWLVPHFEKMLYDNAQLARVYLHAYQITKDPFFETIVHDILSYVEREMVDNTLGEDLLGFYSTQDADSEGEEGKFFVWTTEEIRDVLQMDFSDAEIRFVLDYYGIIAEGNFEGKSIPNIEHDLGDVARNHEFLHSIAEDTIRRARQLLFEVRESRIKPARDEKMLAAWNGMMLAIFAEAGRVFGDSNYVDIARRNGEFLLKRLSNDMGNLYRTFKNDDQGGHAKLDGYLEDYANVIDGLIELYQTTFDPYWFSEAQRLTDHVIVHFRNQDGGFFDTSNQHPAMIARPRSVQDTATPSGNNLMAFNLLRMAAYTGQSEYEIIAKECLAGLTSAMREYPSAFGVALSALHFYSNPVVEVAVLSPRDNDELEEIFSLLIQPFRPTMVMAFAEENQNDQAIPQLLAHRVIRDNQPTVYVCRNFVCDVPVATVEEVATLLKN